MTLYIEINRWTITKLEEAISKYNEEHQYHVHEYVDLINALLGEYLKAKSLPQNTKEVKG